MPYGDGYIGTGHCCACSQVCYHVGGPWLCAAHSWRPPVPVHPPLAAPYGLELIAQLEARIAKLENALQNCPHIRLGAEPTGCDQPDHTD